MRKFKVLPILQRLLDKFSFSSDSLPADVKKWNDFLFHINACFVDFEQERYLLAGIVKDVDQQKNDEIKYALNKQLKMLSKQAGMSEVAASIFHNIGNILNSAVVSLGMLQEKMTESQLLKLKKIANLLEEGVNKKEYILSGEKGNLIPKYISRLSDVLLDKQKEIAQDVEKIEKHIQHINSIVLMQNDMSGTTGIIERVSAEELLEQAIQISYDVTVENVVQIKKRFQFKKDLLIDRTKALQILANLLNNAKQAVMAHQKQVIKKIDIETRESAEKGFFEIQVSDNGVGVEKEVIHKIFSIRYTTKKNGHGFGLHMSAIAAHDMGGKLMVESPGLNQGAVFTLMLPITPEKDNQNVVRLDKDN